MKVLTLNTWQQNGPWEERWEIILQRIHQYKPDIISFQELYDSKWWVELPKRSSYPFLISPKAALTGLVFLGQLPTGKVETYTFQSRSPFEDYSRYALWAEMKWAGRRIQVFTTHLSWKPEDQETRKAQLQELRQWITEKAGEGETILTGDFNATPDSEEMRWFKEESGLTDTFAHMHPDEPGYTWDNQNPFAGNHQPSLLDRRLDYILVRGKRIGSRLTACELLYNEPDSRGIFASDHFGVMATFRD